MIRFFLVYFGVYGGVHLYLFWKVRRLAARDLRVQLCAGAFFLLMVFGPVLVRVLEFQGAAWLSKVMAWVGFLWMAVIFWFFMLGVLVELWNVGTWLAAKAYEPAGRHEIGAGLQILVSAVLIAIGLVWGTVEAWRIRCVEHRIPVARLADASPPVRIAVISDLHLSQTVGKRRLARIIDLVESAEPDVIVSLGDLCDLRSGHAADFARMLRSLDAPLGKFAVMGNHEFYIGPKNAEAFHEAAGFRLLRQEAVQVNGWLRIVGVDDPAGRRTHSGVRMDEDAVLPGEKDRPFTILLKHQPRVRPASVGRFDLQISGHSHGGQIFPFQLFVNLAHAIRPGLHTYPNGARVYVTRGSGTWGPPLRVLAPPEVTVFEIAPGRNRMMNDE